MVIEIASGLFCFLDQCLYRYQSTYMGSFQTVELIETFLNYQVRSAVVNRGYLSPELSSFSVILVMVC